MRPWFHVLVAGGWGLSLCAGCSASRPDETRYDLDGDGTEDHADCAPADPSAWPGAPDPYGDGVDQNCDGADGVDADADGYPAPDGGTPDEVADCNDADPGVHPGATEVDANGVDEDCDGADLVDTDGDGTPDSADCAPDDPSLDGNDRDGDGVTSCEGDCDDADEGVAPGAPERCNGSDDDCDGSVPPEEDDGDGDGAPACADCDDQDPGSAGTDTDHDGFSPCGGDCLEGNPAAFPGATDPWDDGIDQNCDGVDGVDGDGDGFPGNAGEGDPGLDCDDEESGLNRSDADGDGVDTCGGDCDDLDEEVFPGATEGADGLDQDCDGAIDEGTEAGDDDGDSSCEVAPCWGGGTGGDCDDADPSVHPGAVEVCDGVTDNDCDGGVDLDDADTDGDGQAPCSGDCDDTDPQRHGEDHDGDGWSPCGGDCADDDAARAPGAAEAVDGVDQDCDGLVDEGTAAADDDGDGACEAGPCVGGGPDGDCDDADDQRHPGAWESCDTIDQDCDGSTATGALDTTSLSCAGARWRGEAPGDAAGWQVAPAGDQDGDGLADVLVSAYGSDLGAEDAGAVYLLRGPASAGGSLADADAVLVGEAGDDFAGRALDGGRDLDGDGVPDGLIGAEGEDTAGANAGAAYLVRGPLAGEASLASAWAKVLGSSASDGLGGSVAIAGDVDGDGLDDLVLGASGHDGGGNNSGAAWFVPGTVAGIVSVDEVGWRMLGEAPLDYAGGAVAGAGDVNGDGFADLAVAATVNDGGAADGGAVYVVFGPLSGPLELREADSILRGDKSQDYAGSALASAGDVDGDGTDDLLIGAFKADTGAGQDTGTVCLFLGPIAGPLQMVDADFVVSGWTEDGGIGYAVDSAGDVDGDGDPELLLGAYDDGVTSSGAAYLLTWPFDTRLSLADSYAGVRMAGESSGDDAGRSVRGLGDVDGDGRPDLGIGATFFTGDTDTTGAAYLVYASP